MEVYKMKFNKTLLITLLAVGSANCLGADAGIAGIATAYGTPGGAQITADAANTLLRALATEAGDYDRNENLQAASATLLAQFSSKGDVDNLGTTPAFFSLYPLYTADIASQLKAAIQATSKYDREKAARLILISQWMGGKHIENRSEITDNIQADINGVRRGDGGSALIYAAHMGTEEMIRDLLFLGADKSHAINSPGSPADGLNAEGFARKFRSGSGSSSVADMILAS